jgi:hypothetical protein
MSMGGGHSTTTTTQELSPEQRALLAPVLPIAQNYLKHPPKLFPGSAITPFNNTQVNAQQMTMDAANAMLPSMGAIPKELQSVMSGIPNQNAAYQKQVAPGNNFLTNPKILNAKTNPYLQSAIDAATRPAIQTFNEQVLPGITQDSLGAGGLGGTRQGIAEGIASRGLQQTVADTGASMGNANYQAGLQAMIGGLNSANDSAKTGLAANQLLGQILGQKGDILSQMTLPAQLRESVGKQQQMMQQQLLSEKVQKYMSEQMIPFSVAQDVASMAFGIPGGTTKSESTQPGNPMMGMQMAGSALSALPMLFAKSDRRLKKNVRKLGRLIDGLGVYLYQFVDSAIDCIGLLADEVRQTYPQAVLVGSDGYQRVNYTAIPTWMALQHGVR